MLLVAVDFSDATEVLLAVASEEAARSSQPLLLLHVVAPDPDFGGMETGPQSVRDRRAGELKKERHQLDEAAADLRLHGLEVEVRSVQGPTVETILEQVEVHGASRILMATHGHGLWHLVLLGSVSEGVVRASKVPVLLVPLGRG